MIITCIVKVRGSLHHLKLCAESSGEAAVMGCSVLYCREPFHSRKFRAVQKDQIELVFGVLIQWKLYW